jgi:hypothetical protein
MKAVFRVDSSTQMGLLLVVCQLFENVTISQYDIAKLVYLVPLCLKQN